MLALNLRQMAARKAARIMDRVKIHHWNAAPIQRLAEFEKAILYIATPCGTRLDDVALKTFHAPPDDLARLGFAVASRLDPAAPAVADLSEEERTLADEIAQALKAAARPLVVSGAGCRSRAVIEAAANVCRALSKEEATAEIFLTVPEVNSLGLAMLGPAGGTRGRRRRCAKRTARDTLIILENDLFRRTQSRLVTDLLGSAKHVIAIDHLVHATTLKADIVLPAAAFAESSGSLVNNEGRAQRFYQVFLPKGQVRESWRWIRDIMKALGRPEAEKWQILDDLAGCDSRGSSCSGRSSIGCPGRGLSAHGRQGPKAEPPLQRPNGNAGQDRRERAQTA